MPVPYIWSTEFSFVLAGTQRAIRRTVYPSSSPVAHGVTWQWEADIPGRWNDFDIDISTHLEECWNKNISTVDLTGKFGVPYHIDLKNKTQTRIDTGRTRKIRQTFTATSYPLNTNSGNAVPSTQNGLKRKTVINKNSSLKKSKFGSSAAAAGLGPPPQSFPINGLVSLPSNSPSPGSLPQSVMTGSQPIQGPITRNRYNQTVSAFPLPPTTQTSMPGSSSGSIPSSLGPAFGSLQMPTSSPYLQPGSMTSQPIGFGFQSSGFLNFSQASSGQTGNQPFSFGSQPPAM